MNEAYIQFYVLHWVRCNPELDLLQLPLSKQGTTMETVGSINQARTGGPK